MSPSTVKTHTLNIYRKLEVHGRKQAVARAKRARHRMPENSRSFATVGTLVAGSVKPLRDPIFTREVGILRSDHGIRYLRTINMLAPQRSRVS